MQEIWHRAIKFARWQRPAMRREAKFDVSDTTWLVAWRSDRTSVFDRRTFPVLYSTYS